MDTIRENKSRVTSKTVIVAVPKINGTSNERQVIPGLIDGFSLLGIALLLPRGKNPHREFGG